MLVADSIAIHVTNHGGTEDTEIQWYSFDSVSSCLRGPSANGARLWLNVLRQPQDPCRALTQLFHRRRVGDAEIPGCVEAFAGRQRHVLLLDETLGELR